MRIMNNKLLNIVEQIESLCRRIRAREGLAPGSINVLRVLLAALENIAK